MSITVKNITTSFGDQNVLSNISFELKKGEFVGLLGPKDAGKSTLIKILTTDLLADSGEARVDCFDVNFEKKKVLQSVGYLPQNGTLNLDQYVGAYLDLEVKNQDLDETRASEVIAQTGLSPKENKKIGWLSHEFRQRVALATALLHNPDVLILDEPTTGLDANQALDFRKLIRKIGMGKTVLLSTGIVSEVELVCDRVLIIDKGILVADKMLSELRNEKEQVIEAEFDYRVEETFLSRLAYVAQVKNPAGFLYEITFNTTIDMRPAVFDFAHDNRLKILRLHRKNGNLKNLFLELTV